MGRIWTLTEKLVMTTDLKAFHEDMSNYFQWVDEAKVAVTEVRAASDGMSAELVVAELKPGFVYELSVPTLRTTEGESSHELYLMCDDIDATVAELTRKGVRCSMPIAERPWGRLTTIHLPGGADLGVYEPRHPTALKCG